MKNSRGRSRNEETLRVPYVIEYPVEQEQFAYRVKGPREKPLGSYEQGEDAVGLGVCPFTGRPEPTLGWEKLLPPPKVMSIILYCCECQGGDLIGITVFHDFAMASVHITIRDDLGNLIESGEAGLDSNCPELWDYLPTACVPSGTLVIVQAVATDCMGGSGVWQERKRIL